MFALISHTSSWAGSIPTWILVAMGLFVAWRISRGGGGSAVSELAAANAVLEKRVHELGGEVRDLKIENASLTARTDFAQALQPIRDSIQAHEDRAQERFESTTKVLGQISDLLGEVRRAA